MAPRSSDSDQQQLGRLAEAIEDSKADRANLRADLKDSINALGGDIRNLQQTIQSTASQVALLVAQDLGKRMIAVEAAINSYDNLRSRYDQDACARRLDALEGDLRYYRSVLGTGWGVAWRAVAFILGSAAVTTFVERFIHKILN